MRFMEAEKTGYDPKNRLVAIVNTGGEEKTEFTVLKPATGYEKPHSSLIKAQADFKHKITCSQN